MSATVIEYHKTRDFGKKLNATIEFIKQNFKPLFKSLLFIAGPFVMLGSLLFTQLYSNFMTGMMNQMQGVDFLSNDYISMVVYGSIGMLFLIIGGTATIATVNEYIILYEKKKGPNIEVSEVWERVKATFFTVLGTMILYTLVIFAAYIIIIIPIAIFANVSMVLTFFVALACGLGLMYIMITLSLIFIIRAYENVGFGTAFSRCFYLIKEKWWSTFGIIFITSIIRGVISSIFFIPWYISFFVQMMHSTQTQTFEDPSLPMQILNYTLLMLYFACGVILYCIPLIAIAFQYFNLVERKEARGLMSKIESFGTEEQTDEDEEHY